jgi:hypothetical protein
MTRWSIALLAGLIAVAVAPLPVSAQLTKPNIVLIVSDDFGYGDMRVWWWR